MADGRPWSAAFWYQTSASDAAPDRCKVLADTKWAMDRNYEAVARNYPRAKFLLSTSSDPCPDELNHNARVRAALPGHALFDIDLASADLQL